MTSNSYTLCSYTHNDAGFVHDLLSQISYWSLQPSKIIIVDDGSTKAFKTTFDRIPIKVIHTDHNHGAAYAKKIAFAAVKNEFILSVDCDTRISNNYAEVCIDWLKKDPKIAKVSGESRYLAGDDTVSRYLAVVGDNYNIEYTGETELIPSNSFAMRRSVWNNICGDVERELSFCSNNNLCKNIKHYGYLLWTDETIKSWETRRLSRQQICLRFSQRDNTAVFFESMPTGQLEIAIWLEKIFVEPLFQRLEFFINNQHSDFIYLDLLMYTYRISEKLNYAIQLNKISQGFTLAYHAKLRSILEPYPLLWRILRIDMAEMGLALPVVDVSLAHCADWSVLLGVFDSLKIKSEQGESVLDWVNQVGIPKLLEEAKQLKLN